MAREGSVDVLVVIEDHARNLDDNDHLELVGVRTARQHLLPLLAPELLAQRRAPLAIAILLPAHLVRRLLAQGDATVELACGGGAQPGASDEIRRLVVGEVVRQLMVPRDAALERGKILLHLLRRPARRAFDGDVSADILVFLVSLADAHHAHCQDNAHNRHHSNQIAEMQAFKKVEVSV